jgi:hypothetical protein
VAYRSGLLAIHGSAIADVAQEAIDADQATQAERRVTSAESMAIDQTIEAIARPRWCR